MPIEITVGPPVLTINSGNTFMVTDRDGQIGTKTCQGVFSDDTRFVSYYAISANGESWNTLSSTTLNYHMARVHCSNPDFVTEDGPIPGNSLQLSIVRDVGDGICESLEVANFGMSSVRFSLEVALRSDFADIFEVRAHKFVRRGRIETEWKGKKRELHMSYENRDFKRWFVYRVLDCDGKIFYANGRIVFEIELDPGKRWSAQNCYDLHKHKFRVPKDFRIGEQTELKRLQKAWSKQATKLTSQNEDIYRLYQQSVEDLGVLRLESGSDVNQWLPAAGVPWYVTTFGRDSLIISLQSLMVNCQFACGALGKLAQFQATEMDDERDAEPGKILHEIRFGELAHFGRIPHTPYYGTADATPLYLIVLHEVWKWTGDKSVLRKHRDVALRCLEWIDKYGDLDSDGFQEYQTRSSAGYENMCWKDSPDSIMYPNGALVLQPKAVCELQGYVFDAWLRMAEAFEVLGDKRLTEDLRRKAAQLQSRFEEHFWCDDMGFYAYALDKDKKPVKTVASNVGHCMWSGIVKPSRAPNVVKRFFEPDLWSGWGIRTLSAKNPAYNPNSYHNGSVWPHDNGLIAMGFKRYGFAEEAARIARDISEAASYFASHRLPELYAGSQREKNTFPVQYLTANVPQGWAAGSVFHLLQAILGIRGDAPNDKLLIDPRLPHWLPEVTLHGMQVGKATIDLKFWLDGEETRWDAKLQKDKIDILQQRWAPPDIGEKAG